MFKKIVVPIDGSQCADDALEVAFRLAKAESAELAICSIVDPHGMLGSAPPSAATHQLVADSEAQAKSLVEVAVERAQRAGVNARGDVHLGKPSEEILRFAKSNAADLIVMGTHGRGGLKRLLLGSVAESVLRSAQYPVIVVREHTAVATVRV